MPQAPTKHFATIDYDERAILTFPAGLPAFERLTRFLLIEHPSVAPLTFLQSLEEVGVCFPTLPVLSVDAGYELSLSSDDLEVLGFTAAGQEPGENALGCFAIVSVPASGAATANLAAPVVVNLAMRLAVQAVRPDARYSHQHPVTTNKGGVCS
jgi:flagellar assembly factor FliW